MKVLIVGGTGVISTAVVNEAVKQGYDVTCINRGNNHGVTPNPNVKTLHFDVRNHDLAEANLLDKFYDVVVDFICFCDEQVKYSLELFSGKCRQYVFVSTDSVYKLQKDGHYDETTPQSNPEWNYSYQKADCEKVVRDYCKKKGLIYTIVRPSITYGDTRIPYGFMPNYGFHGTFIERIKSGKPIVTWNNGNNIQTMMRVEDFAVGMVGLWQNANAFNEDFNICGDAYSWKEVLDIIDDYLGIKSTRVDVPVNLIVDTFPERKGEFLIDRSQDHIVSNLKLKKAVPTFSLSYTLKDGVRQSMQYYIDNNYLLGMDYVYDGETDRLLSLAGRKERHINYLSQNRIKSYYYYLLGRYGDSLWVRLLYFSKKVIRRIVREFKKLVN